MSKEEGQGEFVNDILRSHRNKVKKKAEEERKKQLQKELAEQKRSRLYAIQKDAESNELLKCILAQAEAKKRTRSSDTEQPKPVLKAKRKTKGKLLGSKSRKAEESEDLNMKKDREVLAIQKKRKAETKKLNAAPVKRKKLTPEEIVENKRIHELQDLYYADMDKGMPEELKMLLDRRNKRKEEESRPKIVELDWKTNKPIADVSSHPASKKPSPLAPIAAKRSHIQSTIVHHPAPPQVSKPHTVPANNRSPPPQKLPLSLGASKTQLKSAPSIHRPPAPVQRHTAVAPLGSARRQEARRRRNEEDDEDSMKDFIVEDDEQEYDPTARKEIEGIKQMFTRGAAYDDRDMGDVQEVGFDTIQREEMVSSYIGQQEDLREEELERQRQHRNDKRY